MICGVTGLRIHDKFGEKEVTGACNCCGTIGGRVGIVVEGCFVSFTLGGSVVLVVCLNSTLGEGVTVIGCCSSTLRDCIGTSELFRFFK